MKELTMLLFKFRIKELFMTPTENALIQFFRYVFVGGIAFLVDAGVLYLVEYLGVHYLIATAIAFIFGLTVNYILSKKFVFTEKANVNDQSEFLIYGIIGLVGLGITEILMYILTDWIHFYFMISKVIVAALVLIWNYLARKIVLYRKN